MGFVRKLSILGYLIILFSIFTPSVFAHDEGQPPFVTINGEPTKHAPITTSSLSDFIRPHDVFDQLFLVNTPVNFVMDPEKLLYEKKLITDREFEWDLGDGVTHSGTSFSHTYKRPGSYFVSMHAVDLETNDKILVFRAILQVVPSSDYVLPKVAVGIRDHGIPTEITTNFSKPIVLEAHVVEGTSPIVHYYWDLGDGKSSNLPVVEHTYDAFHAEARPVLRARDQNGFISDASTIITNSTVSTEEFENPADMPRDESKTFNPQWLIIFVPIVLVFVGLIIYKKKTS